MWGTYLRFRDGFAEAMDSRFWTIEWLDQMVAEQKALFWCVNDSAIVAKVEQFPTGARAITGLWATGEVSDVIEHLIPAAEQFAADNGLQYAFIDSRDAWRRLLKDKGYAPYKYALMKEL